MQRAGSTLYLGGEVTHVGPSTGSAVPLNAHTGALRESFPRVSSGFAMCMLADGAGGWYMGGSFDSVGGIPRARIARLDAQLRVTNWVADVPQRVTALARDGDRLYVGGAGFLLAVSASTGRSLGWSVAITGEPSALLPTHGRVIVASGIMQIDGAFTYGLAAIDSASGRRITTWNPAQGLGDDQTFMALAAKGDTLFAGGHFNGKLSGVPRQNLCAVDLVTGQVLTFAPNPDNDVTSLALHGERLYAGGAFTNIAGSVRERLAAFSVSSGELLPWAPRADGLVHEVLPNGDQLFIVGRFRQVNAVARQFVASVRADDGQLTGWNPAYVNTAPEFAALDDGLLYVGGPLVFTAGGEPREGLAAVDLTTGRPLPWAPRAKDVRALVVDHDLVYVGGRFTTVNNKSRRYLAAIDRHTGRVRSWSPDPDGPVHVLARAHGTLFVGGEFTNIQRRARGRGAAFHLKSRNIRAWDPRVADLQSPHVAAIFAIAPEGGSVILGGKFARLGQTLRSNLAEVDARSGMPTSWNPSPNAPVMSIARSSGSVFVAGGFFRIAGEARPTFARLDATTGLIMPNSPVMDDAVRRVIVHEGLLYTGESDHVRAYDLASGERQDWSLPFAFSYAEAFAFWRGRVFLGTEGTFGLRSGDGPVAVPRTRVPIAMGHALPLTLTRRSASDWSIAFELPTASQVQVDLYDLAGRRVACLADAPMSAGAHRLNWERSSRGHAIPRGIYFVRMVAGTERGTAKVVLR